MCKVNSSLDARRLSDGNLGGPTHWVPNTDVYTTETGLVIKVELAGMRQESMQVIIKGQRLEIRGERTDNSRVPGIKYLVMEIHYGSFNCVIDVPPGYDLGRAGAAYQNGFLRVDVPLAVRPVDKAFVVVVSERR